MRASSGRSSLVPDAFSVNTFSQPARLSASSWSSGDWSVVLTLAYPTRISPRSFRSGDTLVVWKLEEAQAAHA